MSRLGLDRRTLASFLPSAQAIAAFERVFSDVGDTLPSTIEQANMVAANALAAAAQALAMLANLAGEIERLSAAPMHHEYGEADAYRSAVQLGTISVQNHDGVDITGGTIGLDDGTVALPSFYMVDRATGWYRIGADNPGLSIAGTKLLDLSALLVDITGALKVSRQITSSLATGTAPLVVASTTKVTNLYVDRAALADTATILTSPTAFPANATDLPSAITLVNALKAAAITKGL